MQNAPSVSREKKKENFPTVGGIEERARSGARLAVAFLFTSGHCRKQLGTPEQPSSPPSSNQLRKGKQNLQVLLRILMSNANIIQQHKWEVARFCQGCVAAAEGNARRYAHVLMRRGLKIQYEWERVDSSEKVARF